MKNVSQDYIRAVTDYGREWQNTVTITDGVHTETYTSCEINIEEVFSDTDSLSMGKSFASKCSIKLYEPQRTVLYQNSTITIVSKLMVNNAFVDVSMGTFYPSEVKTEDDYETLDIVAYDEMARLDVPYEPRVTLPCTDADVIEDICTQYGLEFDGATDYHQKVDVRDLPQTQTWDEDLPNGQHFKATLTTDYESGIVRLVKEQGSTGTGYGKSIDLPSVANMNFNKHHKYALYGGDFQVRLTLNRDTQWGREYINLYGNSIISLTEQQKLDEISVYFMRIEFFTLISPQEQEGIVQLYDLTEIYGEGNEPTTWEEFVEIHGLDYHPRGLGLTPHLTIDTLYESTVAEMLGYMAGLQGKNAIFNSDNKLVFRWYSADTRFGTRWQDLLNIAWQDLDGTWATEFVDIINFDRSFQHQDGLSLNEGTFTINSITSGSGDNVYTAGTGKGITFENPYITQELVNSIYANLPQDYKTFYVGEVNTFGMPCAEVGDIVYAQMKDGEKRVIYLSNNTWNLTGGCSCITQSVGVPEAEIEFSTESPTDKKINKFKSTIQEVKSRLSNLINSTVGYYTMTEENGIPTGWTIKDNIDHPQNMVKASLGGIGYSRDGGITYDNAITGEGIIADAITTGTITAIDIVGCTLEITVTRRRLRSEYSNNDATRVLQYLAGTITLTGEEIEKYDLNLDGTLATGDSVTIQNFVNGNYGSYIDFTTVFKINPTVGITASVHGVSQNGTYNRTCNGAKILGTSFVGGNNGKTKIGDEISTQTIFVEGEVNCDTLYQRSLLENKRDISPYENGLEKVKNSGIYNFSYNKEEKGTKQHVGFIIGDGYSTPDDVLSNDQKAIDTYSMTSILWKAVQELSSKVDELETKISGLEKGEQNNG